MGNWIWDCSPIVSSAPIVFIHGIKGATLKAGSGALVWLTALQALGLSSPSLSLPLHWQGTAQSRDGIKAVEPLTGVTIIPGLLGEDVYGPWLKAARAMGRPFYPFAYDWRRDNLETTALFEDFLAEVSAKHGGARPAVVAHSMGGLITLAVARRGIRAVGPVVYAGVPFTGGVGFLPDLHAGTSTGLNGRILKPSVLFTFPSVYTLFPLKGQGLHGSGLAEADGAPIAMDFFSAADWKEKKLGAFAPGAAESGFPASASERTAFLTAALERGRRFRELIAPASDYDAKHHPPALVISARNRSALVKALKSGPRSERGWDFQSAPQAPGDGRVSENDATPPRGIAFSRFTSEYEHSALLNDPAVIKAIQAYLDATPLPGDSH